MSIVDSRRHVKDLLDNSFFDGASQFILELNRSEWDFVLSPTCDSAPELNYTISELSELERALDRLVQNAAMLAEYIGHRGTYGCGDSGHDEAFKAAEKKLKKVRKAIGYTNP